MNIPTNRQLTVRMLMIGTLIILLSGCSNHRITHPNSKAPTAPPLPTTNLQAAPAASPGSSTLSFSKNQLNVSQSPPSAAVTRKLPTPSRPIRGIYLSSYAAITPSKMNEIRDVLDRTELNAVVLDINSGTRLLSYIRPPGSNDYPSSSTNGSRRLRAVIQDLKQRNVYMIARIVTFKDSELAAAKPQWAIRSKEGSIWKDGKGHAWIDPHREEAWPYFLAMTDEAAKAGFDEVQFDYVRFPENASKVDRETAYANTRGLAKNVTIRKFLQLAVSHAHQKGLRVSADVFGMVGSTTTDMGIGQRWKDLAAEADVISPMIYPSHYSNGMWGIRHPDLTPGPIIMKALNDTAKQNSALRSRGVHPAEVRPWLQGFTASWVHPHQRYGPPQLVEQIRAVRAAGYDSYLIWNSACRYPVFQT